MKFSALTSLVLIGCCGLTAVVRATGEDTLVTLPAFEVKGLRPWLYAEIPGYQILSLASEKDTRSILTQLRNASHFTSFFFPKGYNLRFTARSTLFLHHFADKQTVDDATQRLQLSFTPKAFTVSAGDAFVEFPTPERIADWMNGRQTPSQFFSLSELVTPRVPVWYREGLHVVIASSKVTDHTLTTSSLNWNGTRVQPLHEVLTVGTSEQFSALNQASGSAVSAFRMGAVLFVHWGFFGEQGKNRAAFLNFIDAASRSPISEDLFRRHFQMDFAEGEARLKEYMRKQAWRPVRFELPLNPESAATPTLVRPATSGEVTRIVGESYLLLGDTAPPSERTRYHAKARSLLVAAHTAGDRDPRLLAQLGLLEFADQNVQAARNYLEAATSSNVPLPRAYTVLSLLRLRGFGAQLGDKTVLTLAQSRAVLAPALTALTLRPMLPDAATIVEDIFLRGVVTPTPGDLDLLDSAVRQYPRNITLLANAVAIELPAQRFDTARELIELSLAWPETDGAIRRKLQIAQEKIPRKSN
ncbi:MAG: hypothetical protein ABIZ04_01505 [Opitutus sp.]